MASGDLAIGSSGDLRDLTAENDEIAEKLRICFLCVVGGLCG